MQRIADQPITARFGETNYLTSWITPNNPSVLLKYNELRGKSMGESIWNLWQYVSNLPYKAIIPSTLKVPGCTFEQEDTWFYPGETIQILVSNCANKAFLLASLLKNLDSTPGNIYCVLGQLQTMGNHAWVQMKVDGTDYYLETTTPDLQKALITIVPERPYVPLVYFDECDVYITDNQADWPTILNGPFAEPEAIDWLEDYLSKEAMPLIR
jgi:hypothetical protein